MDCSMSLVVITGARGYIGSALAKKLANQGYALRLVSRLPNRAPTVSVQATTCEYRAADLRDPQNWSELLHDADAVVHLSSRTDLRAADADPAEDDDINVRPVRALVEAARAADKAPIVVFASAVTIVGARPQIPVDERAPDNPCCIYDRHKLAGETILREATERGILRACTLRLSNVYGYGGASINVNRGILNMMLKRAVSGEPLTLYGDGAYIRDFIHIEDAVDAFRRTLATPEICDGRRYLIASGRGYTLAEAYALVAEVALSQMGRCIEIVRVPEPPDLHPIEKRNFVGDSHAFQKRTGWQPHFDLRAGIADYLVRAARPAMAH
jgi:nucleoside-diphosphate-sugar epimerase